MPPKFNLQKHFRECLVSLYILSHSLFYTTFSFEAAVTAWLIYRSKELRYVRSSNNASQEVKIKMYLL